jgi:hypothetical protein
MTKVIRLEEQPSRHGGRLGRHVEHDPRSRKFGAAPERMSGTRDYVLHRRHGQILDQGDLGSCTGNALTGAANTDHRHRLARGVRSARHPRDRSLRGAGARRA